MPDDISALGWLVILCSLGLGFGLVRFLLVTMAEKAPVTPPAEPDPSAAPGQAQHAPQDRTDREG